MLTLKLAPLYTRTVSAQFQIATVFIVDEMSAIEKSWLDKVSVKVLSWLDKVSVIEKSSLDKVSVQEKSWLDKVIEKILLDNV